MRKVNIYLCLIAICIIGVHDINSTMLLIAPASNENSTSMIPDTIIMPPNFDNIDHPALRCYERVDSNINISKYLLNSPLCVGGQILDSVFWNAHPGEPDEYPKRRLPKVLGWNFIADTSNTTLGLPNPDTIFYPQHSAWSPNVPQCWGPNQHILGSGTGRPFSPDCSHLDISYSDKIINISIPGCNSNLSTCYKVFRTWTIFDSCVGYVKFYTQIIKVYDSKGPTVLYPDTIHVNTESFSCKGRWEVFPPQLSDNCSQELHYQVEVDSGKVSGTDLQGYVVTNLKLGIHIAYIDASDCCSNITEKKVILLVEDNIPPNAVCETRTVVSITGNKSPGNNYAKILAEHLDQGSFDNCAVKIFFKVIRLDQLNGTNNGSNEDQNDKNTNCAGLNGDDDSIIDGNQIYYDDYVNFCCSDVGDIIPVILRVFDRDPGIEPISPFRMSQGGDLHNHFSECRTMVEVQDRTVPTVVAPPNIVVSCSFPFDIDKLSDPNDSTFGRVVTDLSYRQKVYTNDKVCYSYCLKNDKTGYPGEEPGAPPSNPPAGNKACLYYKILFDTTHTDQKYGLVWGFDGYVLSNCDNSSTIIVNDNRQCEQGQIMRIINATGPNGITIKDTQIIWVVECYSFYINPNDDCDPDDDIIWPGNCNGQATTINNCGADMSPENPLLGKPVFHKNADDLCAKVSIEYSDEVNANGPDTCFKIMRTWVITDLCQYDPSIDTVKGKWNYLQLIKILNLVSTEDKQESKNEFMVMPNPSNGKVIIKSVKEIDNIRLISIPGKTTMNFPVPDMHSIELKRVPSGVYFVQAYFKGVYVASAKLIILD